VRKRTDVVNSFSSARKNPQFQSCSNAAEIPHTALESGRTFHNVIKNYLLSSACYLLLDPFTAGLLSEPDRNIVRRSFPSHKVAVKGISFSSARKRSAVSIWLLQRRRNSSQSLGRTFHNVIKNYLLFLSAWNPLYRDLF
jgi:hypothetical protein